MLMNRQRRSNAGVNSRYDEHTYCLVSFPDHSKHALVPSRVVNVDPIDDRTASIKVRGIRRGVHIVGSGSKVEMQHQASNFSSQARSEEVEIADQCDEGTSTPAAAELQEEIHASEFSSHRRDNDSRLDRTKKTNYSIRPTATFDADDDDDDTGILCHQPRVFTPNHNRTTATAPPSSEPTLDFSRMYGGTDSSKRVQPSVDSDSHSSADENNNADSLSGRPKKKAKVKKNLDLTKPVRRQRPVNRKRQPQLDLSTTTGTSSSNRDSELLARLEQLESEVVQVKGSLMKLRRQQVIARRKPWELLTAGDVASAQSGSVHERVREKFHIDTRKLKSPKNRPTMLIRELFRMSGYVHDWKSMLTPNETLLKEFLSAVCVIDEDDFDVVWEMVIQSLAQMPYDQKSNASKRRSKESSYNLSLATDGNSNLSTTASGTAGTAMATTSTITVVSDRSTSQDVKK